MEMEGLSAGATIALPMIATMVWVAIAATTAHLAQVTGQPPLMWFVEGLLFPILSMLAITIIPFREPPAGGGGR